MKILFSDPHLALIWTERAHELGLPFSVIKAARNKLAFLAEAPDERTLRNWKSLNYKQLAGGSGLRQIRVNDQFRIVFDLNTDCIPPTITIVEISDPH